MTVRLQSGVGHAEITDGAVLLDERSGAYYRLNQTAARMLAMLLAGGSTDTVAECLAAVYEVEPDRLARDVDGLVERLRAAGLVAR